MRGVAILLVATFCLVTGCNYLAASPKAGDRIVPERSTLRVGVGNRIDTAPLRIAVADGSFTRAGLHIELVPLKSDADALRGLASGNVDVAFATDVAFFTAAASGTALQFQAEAYTSAPFTMALVTLPDSPYTKLTAKKSPRIAVDELNGLSVLAVRSMFAAAGGDPDRIRFVQYPFEGMQAALRDGSVDAALMIEWFITQAQQSLGARILADSSHGAMMNLPMTGYASSGLFAQVNPRTLALFRQVLTAGQQRASDPTVIRRALPQLAGIDDATADQVALGEYPTSLSGTRLQRVADLMHSSGMLADRLDVQSLLPKPVP
ncbi:ABC transporter substrate-binding protein [Amycolatopsis taiwanensis]|uniref:Sulfonate ABC transporter substrate-binding protein n=1 Tax=Amycolatopsis taiwanensis TaxID=342230 RepID=A0A9W6R7T7_9PSEU|nr:ABC transporter substrate-binding protein [Amycolatopsis taiwanensis]GLY69132.1 sulfonate ABC transporter substrate-binding protein [Amycolatopsis taiwanensis]